MNFPDATIDTLMGMLFPIADELTDGAVSNAGDSVADRSEAAGIFFHEVAEVFEAVADLDREGTSMAAIRKVVAEAQDVVNAKELLKNPSAMVLIDGEMVTADDDPVEEA